MEFKPLEPVSSDDPLYDLFYGGYIKPEDLLANETDIEAVKEAVELVREFLQEAEEAGVLEVI